MKSEADPNVAQPKDRRRWFQFSLRTLLIFTTLCAVACGWVGRRVEQKRKEREAIEKLVKFGGLATWDYQHANNQMAATPSGPGWLRCLLGENFFARVQNVSFRRCEAIADEDLALLEDLPDLISLDLGCTHISDVGLQHTIGLTELEHLWLDHTRIGDDGLKSLEGMRSLQVLDLEDTNITDAGIASVMHLRQLKQLVLQNTRITDVGLKRLALLDSLRGVDVGITFCSPVGIEALQKVLPNCTVSDYP